MCCGVGVGIGIGVGVIVGVVTHFSKFALTSLSLVLLTDFVCSGTCT